MTAYSGVMSRSVIIPYTMYGESVFYHPPLMFFGQMSDSVIPTFQLVSAAPTHGVFWPAPVPQPTHEPINPIYTTGLLDSGTQSAGLMTVTESFVITGIETNVPARVRIYTTVEKRDADLNRQVQTEPSGDHGLLFEAVTIPNQLSLAVSPGVYVVAAGPQIPITVTNQNGSAEAVTVTFTATGME